MSTSPIPAGQAWPAFIEARGATLRGAVDGLGESQHWPLAALRDGQRQQLTHLLRVAVKNVPWYGQSAWARDFIARVTADPARFWDEWRAIPLLTKAALREHGARLNARTLPAAHGPLGSTRTSGSVGIPVEVQTTAVSRLTWNALTVREHLWQERDFGKRLGIIRARHGRDRDSATDTPTWGPPAAELFRTGPGSVIHISRPLPELVAWLRRFDPHYLLTYPSLAAALLEELGPSGRTPALEEVRLMSEPVDADFEARLRDDWQVRVADVYSANEVGNIAFRCRHGRLHEQSEAILVEVLDEAGQPCAPGDSGRVVVTALHNIATPLIRYEIGDYATVGEPCPCGRAHPVIGRVLGRVRNLVRTPDGRRFWPAALLKVRSVAPVRQFQYVQTAPACIELRVVLDRALTSAEEEELRVIVRGLMQYPFEVRVTPVPAIERGPTGKFEEFRSELDA